MGKKWKRYIKANKLIVLLCATTVLFLMVLILALFSTSEEEGIGEVMADAGEEVTRKLYVEGTNWLFMNRYDLYHVGRIENMYVNVLEDRGEWLRVGTPQGEGWMRLSFSPPTFELEALLRQFSTELSVHFENMETGFVYQYNGQRIYPSASVTKAVHGLYIFEQAEQGFIDIDQMYLYIHPIREILRMSISESNDSTTIMLVEAFGLEGYIEFVKELGGNINYIGGLVMDSQLSAAEAGIFARAIFEYLESDGTYSEEFRNQLLDNQFPFIVSDYPVASKSGWYWPYAWHDLAIVYAPSPYTLVILSHRGGWSEQDYEDFRQISMAFQEFNDRWFVEAGN